MAGRFREWIRGGDGRDFLHGNPKVGDHFDADAGGDDILFGMSGDDVYWLGPGTGKDTIVEVAGDTGNVIRLEKDPAALGVRLTADERHLHVALVDDKGEETDRYTVVDHFGRGTGIARVELPDGQTLFDRDDFGAAWLSFVGGTLVFPPVAVGEPGPGQGEDGITRVWEENRFVWTGSSEAGDSFVSGSKSPRTFDEYRGRGGNDIYWLGTDTGHDRVHEHEDNPQGDPGDAIVVKSGISAPGPGLVTDLESAAPAAGDGPVAWVHRSPNGRDLVVAVVEARPGGGHRTLASLAVDRFFVRDSAQVERIVFADDPSATLSLEDLRGAAIVGWSVNDVLEGGPGPDVFDGSAGGDDRLYGFGGGDTYHLGPKTGTDTIFEHVGNARGDGNDRVVVKEGVRIPKGDEMWRFADGKEPTLRVRKSDDGKDLRVEVTADGEVVGALVVDGHYTKPNGRIEEIRDAQGRMVVSEGGLKEARIAGDPGDNTLVGADARDDHFDISAGGADTLRGHGGSDTYWLGFGGNGGTGTIHEARASGDSGDIDVIRLGEDLSAGGEDGRQRSLKVWRSGRHGEDLHVALLTDGDAVSTYIVRSQFPVLSDGLVPGEPLSTRIERVLSVDGKVIHDEASLMEARIAGDEGDNELTGTGSFDDHFDISAGGDDVLRGHGGSDTYWLGSGGDGGTGTIHEARTPGDIDVIRLDEDLSAVGEDGRQRSLKVWRSGRYGQDLHVALLVEGNAVSKYIVRDQYRHSGGLGGRIERVLSVDGKVIHDEASLMEARIAGDEGDNVLTGTVRFDDHFDISAGGKDVLRGLSGSDTYWLGPGGNGGTGTIHEAWTPGDIDVIRLGEDLSAVGEDGRQRSLKVWRSGRRGQDLHVALLVDGDVDSAYIVRSQFPSSLHGLAPGEPLPTAIERVLSVDGKTIHDGTSLLKARIIGDERDNVLFGSAHLDDHFDISAGGKDVLHGKGGSDTYWLSSGANGDTGTIREWGTGDHPNNDVDVIRLDEGLVGEDGRQRSLEVWRDSWGTDLHVALLVDGNTVSKYIVEDQWDRLGGWDGRIEHVLSVDGEVIHDETSLMKARIVGDEGDNVLYGTAGFDDHFDISAGGDDLLLGLDGNDVYWLGSGGDGGTGTIHEAWTPGDIDVIRLGEDLSAVGEDGRQRSLKIWRSGHHGQDLHVALLVDGDVDSAYIVRSQFPSSLPDGLAPGEPLPTAIERVLSVDGKTIHDGASLLKVRIVGDGGDNVLYGSAHLDDHFDISAGGNDVLHGEGGSDTYWLGSGGNGGTGRIREWGTDDPSNNDVDVIRLDEDLSAAGEDGRQRSLKVWRDSWGTDLHVALLVDGNTVSKYVVEEQWRGRTELGGWDGRIERVLSVDGEIIHDEASLMKARIVGDEGDNTLAGRKRFDDHFDISAGGNDLLLGFSGDDVYWLGSGGNGGRGTIIESDSPDVRQWDTPDNRDFDVIRLKEDISVVGEDGRQRSLEVWRDSSGASLHVALLVDGEIGSMYTVAGHYLPRPHSSSDVEAILSVDGAVIHDADALMEVRIVGGAGDDLLHGQDHLDDHFDGSRGGSDALYGVGGDDVYWLERGTGNDRVHEHMEAVWHREDGSVEPWPGPGVRVEHRHRMAHSQDGDGDSGDTIRIASPHIGRSDVGVVREGSDLVVRLLGDDGRPTDSLTVVDHFVDEVAQVERIELNGKRLLISDLTQAVDSIARFNADGSWGATLDMVPDSAWRDPSDFLGGSTA